MWKIKIFLILLICFIFTGLFGQSSYEIAVERFDMAINDGRGILEDYNNNFHGNLEGGQVLIMRGYLNMYRATMNEFYLKKFSVQAKGLIQTRDDIYTADHPNDPPREDYNSNVRATWINIDYSTDYCAFVLHSGRITYPLADFAQMVINNPDLWYVTDDDGQNLIDVANWLVDRIHETILAHDDQWVDCSQDPQFCYDNLYQHIPIIEWLSYPDAVIVYAGWGFYSFRCDAPISDNNYADCNTNERTILPYNQMNAMGRTLVMMYLATQDNFYLNKALRLARFWGFALCDHGNYYSFPYSIYGGICIHMEDLSHATINATFALLCYKNGIAFTYQNMEKLANTFQEHIYVEPLVLNEKVDGSGTDLNLSGNTASGANIFDGLRWLPFTEFKPDMFQVISDILTEDVLFNPGERKSLFLHDISNLELYKNLFEPIGITRAPGEASQWIGVDGGDFNGDGTKEFVSVRNGDARFFIWDLQNDGNINLIASTPSTLFGINSEWAGVAAGDFDADGIDEIAGVRNGDGNFYMLEQSGTSISIVAENTQPGSESNWTDITAGDIDGDGIDEIIAFRISDKRFFILEYNTGTLQISNSSTPFADIFMGLAAGDFDGDGRDEWVAYSVIQEKLLMFEYANNTISQISTGPSLGAFNLFHGVGAGDFDGDGIDEIIAIPNYSFSSGLTNGNFYIYEGVNFDFIGVEPFPDDQGNGVITGERLIDDDLKNMLISLRNFDGDITIFSTGIENIAQTCTDLVMDDLNLQSGTENEYFARNTITAGTNFTVEAGANTVLRAGNKITLKHGFHAKQGSYFRAYIDPGIACENGGGKWSGHSNAQTSAYEPPALPEEETEPEKEEQPPIQKPTEIVMFPNPTSGQFTILVLSEEQTEISVYVSDLLSNIVYQKENITSPYHTIDISSASKGIYFVKIVSDNDVFVEKLIYQ